MLNSWKERLIQKQIHKWLNRRIKINNKNIFSKILTQFNMCNSCRRTPNRWKDN